MQEINFTKELTALIQLLDEPDEKVYAAIRTHIIDMGVDTLPVLEEIKSNTLAPKEITRVKEIINTIRIEDVSGKLTTWAALGNSNLLEAWILISGFHFPEEDNEKLKASVDKIYRDIWVEMNNELTALEKIRVINHVFYNVYQFDGLPGTKSVLPPYLIGNILRMQKGNPLSIAMLYLIVVQRLNIPMFGVNLPKHLILAYTNGKTMLKQAADYRAEDVLFYVNPYNKGAVFRKSEIELYVKQLNIPEQEEFYFPCENKAIIRRLLEELTLIHKKNHNIFLAGAMEYFLKAIV